MFSVCVRVCVCVCVSVAGWGGGGGGSGACEREGQKGVFSFGQQDLLQPSLARVDKRQLSSRRQGHFSRLEKNFKNSFIKKSKSDEISLN